MTYIKGDIMNKIKESIKHIMSDHKVLAAGVIIVVVVLAIY